MYKAIEECVSINKALKKYGLVKLTWGNASVISEDGKFIAIKPSGVPFNDLTFSQISVIDVYSNKLISGMSPSVDAPIHLEIYKAFPEIKSVIHSHSKYATSWAQANMPIPILGTTHADYFLKSIPLARNLKEEELENYEQNIGISVVDYFQKEKINPLNIPAILLPGHGVLTFSDNAKKTLDCAIVVEEIAEMAYITLSLNPTLKITEFNQRLYSKHFERKNGINKYYGQ